MSPSSQRSLEDRILHECGYHEILSTTARGHYSRMFGLSVSGHASVQQYFSLCLLPPSIHNLFAFSSGKAPNSSFIFSYLPLSCENFFFIIK